MLTWAARELQERGINSVAARVVLEHLKKEPIPGFSKLTLSGAVLLGIGSTIYAIWCPTRIKEFSRDQWRDELQRSLVHYLPYTWQFTWLRAVCMLCYILGGSAILFVLVTKIYNAFEFLWTNG
jgi:hypothetical protein